MDSRAGDIFYGLTRNGTVGLVQSGGNPDCHVVVPALPRLFGQLSPVLHTLERQMQRRKAAGILLDLDPKNQTGGMQLMCDKIREERKGCLFDLGGKGWWSIGRPSLGRFDIRRYLSFTGAKPIEEKACLCSAIISYDQHELRDLQQS